MGWISVKDKLPEDRSLVIVARGDDRWVFPGFVKDGNWYNAIDDMREYHVSHWIPLPSPPTEHRGSRPGPDPSFADAAFREFTPEDEEALREKEG